MDFEGNAINQERSPTKISEELKACHRKVVDQPGPTDAKGEETTQELGDKGTSNQDPVPGPSSSNPSEPEEGNPIPRPLYEPISDEENEVETVVPSSETRRLSHYRGHHERQLASAYAEGTKDNPIQLD